MTPRSTALELPAFTALPDLAVRTLGGSVIWANDDLFAERENLINALPAEYRPAHFGHKGQIYDGWETRRRRDLGPDGGHDQAIVRLGVPGVIAGIDVDTSWFLGNYPPLISIEAAAVEGYPSVDAVLSDAKWVTIVPQTPALGNQQNFYPVDSVERFTHVRLAIYPDGGVARLRVHGRAAPDPQFFGHGTVDLAALENGGLVSACSNMFYSSPNNMLLPGPPRSMGEGWETSRRRDGGNDWVEVALAARGRIAIAEFDTSYFLGNSPGEVVLRGRDSDGEWVELLARTPLQADTRHRYRIDSEVPVTDIRIDVFPDGGMARLRMWGEIAR